LYHLWESKKLISITELSERLEVSKSTASNMAKSLQEMGWVNYKKYQPLQLTEKGRKAAAKVIRKHRLTEMFLYEIMGFSWDEVHEVAEQLEHIDSERLFARMDEMLDHPSLDPHGSPIPDKDGNVQLQKYSLLTDIASGQKVEIRALADSSKAFLRYLDQVGIGIGTVINVLKVESFDRSLLVSYNEKTSSLISEKVGKNLLVKLL
ncbi:MAG: metal-dependent transcriptional regulator, partial [Bacteroidota bacterium]